MSISIIVLNTRLLIQGKKNDGFEIRLKHELKKVDIKSIDELEWEEKD